MNPPTQGWPALGAIAPLHARPAPLAAPAGRHHAGLQVPAIAPAPAPPPAPPAPMVPAARPEADVQWIVGWLRDLLVIAMAITNLLHAGGGH